MISCIDDNYNLFLSDPERHNIVYLGFDIPGQAVDL